ncbi:hypothetical protein ACJX0J_041621, partial [Zea mays]
MAFFATEKDIALIIGDFSRTTGTQTQTTEYKNIANCQVIKRLNYMRWILQYLLNKIVKLDLVPTQSYYSAVGTQGTLSIGWYIFAPFWSSISMHYMLVNYLILHFFINTTYFVEKTTRIAMLKQYDREFQQRHDESVAVMQIDKKLDIANIILFLFLWEFIGMRSNMQNNKWTYFIAICNMYNMSTFAVIMFENVNNIIAYFLEALTHLFGIAIGQVLYLRPYVYLQIFFR